MSMTSYSSGSFNSVLNWKSTVTDGKKTWKVTDKQGREVTQTGSRRPGQSKAATSTKALDDLRKNGNVKPVADFETRIRRADTVRSEEVRKKGNGNLQEMEDDRLSTLSSDSEVVGLGHGVKEFLLKAGYTLNKDAIQSFRFVGPEDGSGSGALGTRRESVTVDNDLLNEQRANLDGETDVSDDESIVYVGPSLEEVQEKNREMMLMKLKGKEFDEGQREEIVSRIRVKKANSVNNAQSGLNTFQEMNILGDD